MNKKKYGILNSTKFMLQTAWKHRRSVVYIGLLITLLNVIIEILQLYTVPEILATLESSGSLNELIKTIAFFSLLMVILSSLRRYFAIDAKTIISRSGLVDIRRNIQMAINYKAGRTSFPNTRNADVMTIFAAAENATINNESSTERIFDTIICLLSATISFICYLFVMAKLNYFLIFLSLITTIAGYLVKRYLNEHYYRMGKEEGSYRKKFKYIRSKAESPQLAKDIRIFGLQSWILDVYESLLNAFEVFTYRKEGMFLWASVLDTGLLLLRNGMAYFYLLELVIRKGITAAEFVLVFNAISKFTEKIMEILTNISQLHKQTLEISYVQEFLNLPEPFLFEEGISIPQTDKYEIRLVNVSFRYPGTTKYIFRNLSLTIRSGEKLAIVGLNGTGKTTIIKLISGLYDPDAGSILLNGEDIRKYNRLEYYKLFSAILQDSAVMEMTIAENVAQTISGIDCNRVQNCLKEAGLWETVCKLPKGIDTHIGRGIYEDGILLSGGQTQRLLLARALYKNSPILLLDEPTAALDPIAEQEIYCKYNEMTTNKTSIFISHRLASTKFCDRIILLSNGHVAEEGTHDELLKRHGAYTNLFEIQGRYYQERIDCGYEAK